MADGWDRATENVSSPSAKLSATTLTVTVWLSGNPGRNVRVPVAAAKSSASAVPATVA